MALAKSSADSVISPQRLATITTDANGTAK